MNAWSGSTLSQNSYGCPSPGPGGVSFGRMKPIESPYLDFATFARPRTFSDMIDWSEYVYQLSDDMKNGLDKLYGYFSTRLMIRDNNQDIGIADVAHVMKWERLLSQALLYGVEEMQLGMNVAVYGNDFVTITLAHTRVMRCPECNWSIKVNDVRKIKGMDFGFRDMAFFGRCQGLCKKRGTNPRRRMKVFQFSERRPENLIIRHWPIRELEFDFLEALNRLRVYHRIPQRKKNLLLQEQDPDALHDEDWSVLQAVCSDSMLEFDDRVMFHAKEPTLSGLENRGLGIPRTLSLARQHWLVQLLKKQCQALAAAYVAPIEFFSLAQPNHTGMAGDPSIANNLGEMGNHVDQMLASHRRDPTRKFFVPYPINYQVAGANANQYVPVDLMKWAGEELSNSLVPRAMLSGELTLQTSPVFIRMFESTNRAIPAIYNAFLWFFVSRVAELLTYEPVQASHSPVSTEDNLAIDQLLQQAAMMGKVSDSSWQSRLNIDPRWEKASMLAEQKQSLELERDLQKLQEDFSVVDQTKQMAMEGGDPSAEGAPAASPPGGVLLPSQGFMPSKDVRQLDQDAQMMAQALLALPPQQRRAELNTLNKSDQMFHGLVTSYLAKQRNEMGQEARQQMFPTA